MSARIVCILILTILSFTAIGHFVEGNTLLYWIPNRAGLFSHFLQLKSMYKHATGMGRNLIVAPSKSPHYGNMTIEMCSIFELPSRVTCAPTPSEIPCEDSYGELAWEDNKDICYSGSITLGAKMKGRHFVLAAVDLPISLRFRPHYQKTAQRFRRALLRLAGEERGDKVHVTVVHWRRGDQLLGRCTNRVDSSVNCADGAALVQSVRSSRPHDDQDGVHHLVYVATNEPQDSVQMRILRESGFVTLDDVVRASGDAKVRDMDLFEVLAAEVTLMVAADTFLGWGLSEINDVVEHERRLAGRAFCSADLSSAGRRAGEESGGKEDSEDGAGPLPVTASETWCSLLLRRKEEEQGQQRGGKEAA